MGLCLPPSDLRVKPCLCFYCLALERMWVSWSPPRALRRYFTTGVPAPPHPPPPPHQSRAQSAMAGHPSPWLLITGY